MGIKVKSLESHTTKVAQVATVCINAFPPGTSMGEIPYAPNRLDSVDLSVFISYQSHGYTKKKKKINPQRQGRTDPMTIGAHYTSSFMV